VGRVREIRFDPQRYLALVSMNIDSRYEFPRDTIAMILTSGLLGEQYVGFSVGGDDRMLKDGETIAKTQSAIVLENMIGQFLFNKAAEGPDAKAQSGDARKP
jgi:phospholipid/cholesterol/gamma-HCH transport system substrate-binding protein